MTDYKDIESAPVDELLPDESVMAEEGTANTDEAQSLKKTRLQILLGDEDTEGESLKDMFTELLNSGEWVKRNWKFLLIVFVCLLLFVTNRYQAQLEIIEEARLKKELNEWKYIWLTKFSTLTRSTRQSNIEESLKQQGDSTLRLSKDAPFIINEE